MKLKAEMVVLSACDTAKGDVTSDGIVGLSRSRFACDKGNADRRRGRAVSL
ncbi:MAG: CHAT domain-containing protein [Myxacorys californica WJT36-NPBG1]|nr:CHAT domain-containing protein [Myxacorys californica WJT36-NPBG1]